MTPITTFSETEWDNLIGFLQEGQVIPIIGPELSLVRDPASGELIRFDLWLARQLAARYSDLKCEPNWTLNQVVCTALRAGLKGPSLNATLKRLIAQHPFEPPEALQTLSQMDCFRLFVTTAIDPLLEKALSGEATGTPPLALGFGPKRGDDLPCAAENLPSQTAYHLFGRPDFSSGAAICEEDTIEWLAALQTPTHAPERLSAALESNHLLLIGLGLDGWLARFFLRAAKRRPLKEERDHQEYLADPAALADGDLVVFLRAMSRTTLLVEGVLDPHEFVKELWRRYQDAAGSALAKPAAPLRFLPPEREMPPNAVFISYSRTDLEFAKRLKAACDSRGIVTWFDIDRLETGDDYAAKIKANIGRCTYFVPVISSAALARDEAFFYREWKWAEDRLEAMPGGARFILPLIADDTSPQHFRLSPTFRKLDILPAPGGEVPGKFLDQLKELTGGLPHGAA